MRFSILFAAIAILYGCAGTQPISRATVQGAQVQPAQKEVFITFDPAGKNVQAKNFSSGKELLGEIQRLGGPRGQYETDAAFSSRMSSFGNFSVGGMVTPSAIKFDRGTGEFSLSVLMRDAQGAGFKSGLDALRAVNTDYPSFNLGEDIYSRGQYSGQNSFGATAVIEKQKIDRYFLVFSPVPKAPGNIFFYKVSGKLNLSAEEMEAQRENIRVVFTVKPVPGFVQVVKNFHEPTITSPHESEIDSYFFESRVFWIKVVNIRTGKVYAEEARMSIETI
ncbi:hypothetical protein G9Q86_00600 [Pseudomonas sp. CCUG 57209]|uniref:hypothetical protein n=1 Tax=Pseudomonas sivasensis TaxID=1880678 RepID=UPI0015EC6851|nr:hypothetical protein [Pseudomonas sivasensis]MBA2927053.1 hypothetical protein [Pseudomonas sivasensis]